jgi:hypothetical protein
VTTYVEDEKRDFIIAQRDDIQAIACEFVAWAINPSEISTWDER